MRTVFPLHDGYVHEKLGAALSTLAGSEGPTTERFALAYDSQLRKLETSNLDDLKIPREIAASLQEILGQLREGFVRSSGDYSRDLRDIDETEIRELISGLLSIYGEICRPLPHSYFDYDSEVHEDG